MKKYNILNNSLGWFCFVVAAVTYLLTLEPTASFWDCPEFITQGYKLEIGHPPGNPIFMLTARFFANFAFGDVTKVALMINAMSALLSAATILLLFWTITHLVKKLVVKDQSAEVSLTKMIVIFSSGICGALMYAWSDTFWFSAVEGEVYAFSSFCTALVFWLILKWENRADRPGSDKYLILIAYVIGISIAVHLLNLLCIPAIVLVIYFKKKQNANLLGALLALGISFAIVGLILYGIVPGLVSVAQKFELFCVNTLHLSFNTGVLIYAIVTLAAFAWTLYALANYKKFDLTLIKISFLFCILLSGILLIGESILIPLLLFAGLCLYLVWAKKLHIRWLWLITMSIFVIFIGYSSYALLLVRSSAHTPMNQNAPDNVFTLASYLNREQYGDRPLIYGETLTWKYNQDGDKDQQNGIIYVVKDNGPFVPIDYTPKVTEGRKEYAPQIKTNPSDPDRYHFTGRKKEYETASETKRLFPRMYNTGNLNSYDSWLSNDLNGIEVKAKIFQDALGNDLEPVSIQKATFGENLRFFLTYQLNHMYWRYFMWNFAGRQNDIQGNGEPTHGNWISGIPMIDNARLGDQSLLPDELGKDNKGHNVFFMLPLLMGLIGLIWQSTCGRRGIEQFWVVFFLFFMTGIAIVLYLNQTPDQPRERDYAFAGSFYAFAIWVGMGAVGLWHFLCYFFGKRPKVPITPKSKRLKQVDDTFEPESNTPASNRSLIFAGIAAIIGLIVPIQVVSQTWDDHDRSGRYTARDYGMNYLNSLDDNAIIFTYGDNDTFPLWYAQEVEGVRTDVKVVNLSYLTTDWYAHQLRRQSYDAAPIDMQITPDVYAYNTDGQYYFTFRGSSGTPVDLTTALKKTYEDVDMDRGNSVFSNYNIIIPANGDEAIKAGRLNADDAIDDIQLDLRRAGNGLGFNSVMVLDMLNTSAKNGWNRPIYFATTVPNNNYIGLEPYFKQTGLAYEVVPNRDNSLVNVDKMYRNITERFRWGGLDKVENGKIYLDETVRRMALSNRNVIYDLIKEMIRRSEIPAYPEVLPDSVELIASQTTLINPEYFTKIDTLLKLQEEKIPETILPHKILEVLDLSDIYYDLWRLTGEQKYRKKGLDIANKALDRFAKYLIYYNSLRENKPNLFGMLSNEDHIVMHYYPELIIQCAKFKSGLESSNDQIIANFREKISEIEKNHNLDLTPYLQY